MTLRPALGVLLLLAATSVVRADEPAKPLAAALTVELPTKLNGSDCNKTQVPGGEGKMIICISKDFFAGGIAGVTVVPEAQATYEELVAQMRESFHESGPLKVIKEERFAPATAPDAVGLRAEYRTGTGYKFTWSVSYDGAFTRVLMTVFGKPDRKKIEPEILAKIFGPDRYPPKVPVASTPLRQGIAQ
jgi:hypothetical protein